MNDRLLGSRMPLGLGTPKRLYLEQETISQQMSSLRIDRRFS